MILASHSTAWKMSLLRRRDKTNTNTNQIIQVAYHKFLSVAYTYLYIYTYIYIYLFCLFKTTKNIIIYKKYHNNLIEGT